MIPIHWRKLLGRKNYFMNNIEEDQIYIRLGKTRRKSICNGGRRVLRNPSLEIVIKDNQLLKNPK
jgi:hypothetical protein